MQSGVVKADCVLYSCSKDEIADTHAASSGESVVPEVSRFYGLIITMYFGDPSRHPMPHFHARYGEYEASFAIDPPAWLAGSLPRKPLQLVLAWAEIHQQELLTNWQKLLDEQPVGKIAGLR